MRKRITTLITLIIITILGIIIILNSKNKSYEINDTNDGSFAFYYENEKGNYVESNEVKWSTGDYILNTEDSTCDGKKNPEFLSWNNDNKSVILTRNKATKCNLYFDKIIKIEYIEDLVDISLLVNNGTTLKGKTIVLTRNLDFKNSHGNDYKNKDNEEYNDFNNDNITGKTIYEELTESSGAGFLPIGNTTYAFEGTFEGNNYTIDNIYINNQNLNYVGFFGNVKNASISNLTINGSITTTIPSMMGTFIGNSQDSSVKNCHNKATVKNIGVLNQEYNTGGLVGLVNGTKNGETIINNCSNEGNISGGNSVGGLVGQVATNAKVIMDNDTNAGEISNIDGTRVGGLVGRNMSKPNLTITNSYNEATVSTNVLTVAYIGGIVGQNYGNVTLENSHNSGNVTNIQTNYPDTLGLYTFLGGVIGSSIGANNKAIMKKCYNTGDVSRGSDTGGIVGYHNGDTVIVDRCYNTGNILATEIGTQWDSFSGGIVGYSLNANNYILNSYNTFVNNKNNEGTVKSNGHYTGGIFGMITSPENNQTVSIILNSYNIGMAVSAKSYAGILGSGNGNITINNVYNAGEIQSAIEPLGIGYLFSACNYNIQNTYYNSKYKATNLDASIGTAYDNMQSDEFLNKLNLQVQELNNKGLETIDSNLQGYTLCNWKKEINNYPTLVIE